jgi:hypothetical protein
VTLPPQWEKDALVEQASPLDGEFFRSVELAYGHPDDVIRGEGTRLHGGASSSLGCPPSTVRETRRPRSENPPLD